MLGQEDVRKGLGVLLKGEGIGSYPPCFPPPPPPPAAVSSLSSPHTTPRPPPILGASGLSWSRWPVLEPVACPGAGGLSWREGQEWLSDPSPSSQRDAAFLRTQKGSGVLRFRREAGTYR
ncbi:unnamed protein product [Pipistrellus nathusii]|uniref:Uncharacterized protein n=1 Tax=Pipistrellus nathusii TaxID=59473 RepID=A0ABN9ZUM1_PIPNA